MILTVCSQLKQLKKQPEKKIRLELYFPTSGQLKVMPQSIKLLTISINNNFSVPNNSSSNWNIYFEKALLTPEASNQTSLFHSITLVQHTYIVSNLVDLSEFDKSVI